MGIIKYFVNVFLLCIVSSICFSQISIKGQVVDLNKQGLESATVALYSSGDSSLIEYTLTNKVGKFEIRTIRNHLFPAYLVITYSGLKDSVIKLESYKQWELESTILYPIAKSLQEVIIESRAPIIVKKDTIEFNANYFKTNENAVIEDLLKKLPGVEVDIKGNIFINGKRVNKILIDGKEFFGNDPLVASKNLPASIVEKVQVTDDKESNPDGLSGHAQTGKAINIKLKKDVKGGMFGKVYGGYGTKERFEGGLLANSFRDTTQITLIGFANNLNRSAFTFSEIRSLGGFRRSGLNSVSSSKEGLAVNGISFGGVAKGLEKTGGGGVNFNTVIGKNTSLNVQFFSAYSELETKSTSLIEQKIGDKIINSRIQENSRRSDQNNKVLFKLKTKLNKNTEITVMPGLVVGTQRSVYQTTTNTLANFELLNKGENQRSDKTDLRQYSNLFLLVKKYEKLGRSLTISSIFNYDYSENPTFFEVFNLFYTPNNTADSSRDKRRYDDNKTIFYNTLTYQEPLNKKTILIIGGQMNFVKTSNSIEAFKWDTTSKDYAIYLDTLSSSIARSTFSIQPSIGLKRIMAFGGLTARVAYEHQFIVNKISQAELKKDRNYLLPNIMFEQNSFSVNYTTYTNQPSASQLQPVIDNSNSLFIYSGNPNLIPEYTHQLAINNLINKKKSAVTINIYSNSNLTNHKIIYKRNNLNNGVQIINPVNYGSSIGSTLGVGITKLIKKQDFAFTLKLGPDVSMQNVKVLVNDFQSTLNRFSVGGTIAPAINIQNKLDVAISYTINSIKADYSNDRLKSYYYKTHTAECIFSWKVLKYLSTDFNVSYFRNSNLLPGFNKDFWLGNLSLSYSVLKSKGQMKLSCFDLFNQNTSVTRINQENYLKTTESEVLRRYFLFSFIYSFNKVSIKTK